MHQSAFILFSYAFLVISQKFGNFYFLVPNYPREKIPYLDTFHTVLLISEDTSVLTAQLK